MFELQRIIKESKTERRSLFITILDLLVPQLSSITTKTDRLVKKTYYLSKYMRKTLL